MAGPSPSILRILPFAAAAAVAAAILLPGTAVDRAAFTAASLGIANPPFFVTGSGKPADPWKLRTLASKRSSAGAAPVVVSLGDDPDGFFQSFPQAPIDIAVVLKNLRRLGGNKAAVATVLAWDEPDPIGLAALDNVLGGFDSLVMCAPLARGAVSDPLPAAFRNASLAAAGIEGASALPAVNRIPVSGAILADSAAAGFLALESEPATSSIPLFARWDDRVVLAFPLLAAMQRLAVPLEKLEIRLGAYIRLGPEGPVLPVDSEGRIAGSALQRVHADVVPARDVIDREDPLVSSGGAVILRDDRSAAGDSTRVFSTRLAPLVATLASREGLSETTAYPRASERTEWTLLGLVVLAATLAARPRGMARAVLLGLLAAAVVIIHLLGFGVFHTWLPGLPALAAVSAAALASLPPARAKVVPVAVDPPVPDQPAEATGEPAPAPPEETPAPPAGKAAPEKAAKKAPARKTQAKKAPAKKAPAKKAAPKKRKK